MKRILSLICTLAMFSGTGIMALAGNLKFSSTIHDFGPVLMSDGALNCVFTAKNVGKSPVVIKSVTTSCSCTSVTWPHEAIAPGQTARITAKYTNDEGPYFFDKTLTVKFADGSSPILLHIRGISQEEKKADSEIFTNVYGGVIGLSPTELSLKNLEMGHQQTDQTMIANLSGQPVKLSFLSPSPGLTLNVSPNPVPARSRANIYYTITAQKGLWGRNEYSAVMAINGKSTGRAFTVEAFTAMNFSGMTKEQKAQGSKPLFRESTFSFGHKKQGSKFKASFTCENVGKSPLKIYKVDTDYSGTGTVTVPDIAPGSSASFSVTTDTSKMQKGEALVIITLTTNSPLRPIVKLFLAGWID